MDGLGDAGVDDESVRFTLSRKVCKLVSLGVGNTIARILSLGRRSRKSEFGSRIEVLAG